MFTKNIDNVYIQEHLLVMALVILAFLNFFRNLPSHDCFDLFWMRFFLKLVVLAEEFFFFKEHIHNCSCSHSSSSDIWQDIFLGSVDSHSRVCCIKQQISLCTFFCSPFCLDLRCNSNHLNILILLRRQSATYSKERILNLAWESRPKISSSWTTCLVLLWKWPSLLSKAITTQ